MLALNACTTPKYNYQAESVDLSFPALGAVTKVGVGEIMLKQGKASDVDSIFLRETVSIGGWGTYIFESGYYSKVGSDQDSTFYLPERSSEGGKVNRWRMSEPFEAMQIMNNDQSLCAVNRLGYRFCEKSVSFKRIQRPSIESDNFQQTLIYSGMIENRLNIGYREFSNSHARPAFSNDVAYDLNQSSEIGYKGALIKIIEATNKSVTYKVIKNFNESGF